MKINTRTIIVSFLLIMSLTSYIFLSNIEVSEPEEVTTIELLEVSEEKENSSKMILPDLTLFQKLIGTLTTVMQN